MRRVIFSILVLTGVCAAGVMTPELLWKLQRVSDPQVSPDGRTVVYSVVSPNLDANIKPSQIWSIPLGGGAAKQLTREGSQNLRPRWSPDGRRIAFTSNRGGSMQIWTMAADGSDPKQVTRIYTEASGETWSPDGTQLLFLSDVFPDCADEACNKTRAEEQEKSKVKAKHEARLLYRHWTSWKEGKRSHLFIVPAAGGPLRDLTPGDHDVPPFSLGGPDDYAFSPDGKEVAYTSNHDAIEAISTNNDLFLVPAAGGPAKKITTNPGSDSSPVYSPDGRSIAYRAQFEAGHESDRFRLMLYDRASGKHSNLTENYDRWVNSITWAPDGKSMFLVVEDEGSDSIFTIPASGGTPKAVVKGGINDDVSVTPDGKTLVFTHASMQRPNEVATAPAAGSEPQPLTHAND